MPKKEKMIPCTIVSSVKRNGKWIIRETNSGQMPEKLNKTKTKGFKARDVGDIKTFWSKGVYHVKDNKLNQEVIYIPKKSPTATPKPTKSTKSANKTRSKTKKR